MLNLPAEITPFIGRNKEPDELARLLTDPGCRLVTLVGPGGIGKTRLAIQAARDNAAQFHDGVYFVGLQPVSSGEFLLSSIADSLRYALRGSDDTGQLLDYLRDRTLLLVLDNFEHLLPAVDLLESILVSAPGVKLMVTSREVLNLRGEWLYPVHGMVYPKDETETRVEEYGAVQL